MIRFLRFALLALVICVMGSPAFAAHCALCNEALVCENTSHTGSICLFGDDWCQNFVSGCMGVADRDTLADTLSIASVEIVTPNGVKTTNEAPRLAARKPVVKTAASTFNR